MIPVEWPIWTSPWCNRFLKCWYIIIWRNLPPHRIIVNMNVNKTIFSTTKYWTSTHNKRLKETIHSTCMSELHAAFNPRKTVQTITSYNRNSETHHLKLWSRSTSSGHPLQGNKHRFCIYIPLQLSELNFHTYKQENWQGNMLVYSITQQG